MAEYKDASLELQAALQAWWIFLTIGMLPIVFIAGDGLGRVGFLVVELFFLVTLAGSSFRRWLRVYRAKTDLEEEEATALKEYYKDHPPGSGNQLQG